MAELALPTQKTKAWFPLPQRGRKKVCFLQLKGGSRPAGNKSGSMKGSPQPRFSAHYLTEPKNAEAPHVPRRISYYGPF